MILEERIAAFRELGEQISNLDPNELDNLYLGAKANNNWFTQESVKLMLTGISKWLNDKALDKWTSPYSFSGDSKRVGLVMAGNIPLVGFHDMLAILISGHQLALKLSSQDSFLPRFMIEKLIDLEPRFKEKITIPDNLKGVDAIIATGSDNSSRYFEYYFAKMPHIIRKNRSSCAVLTGNEKLEELENLGLDVFQYYGLGCRNVSKLHVPKDYNFEPLIKSWQKYENVISHHKYHNNYDYNKSIYLVNKEQHLDSGFLLFKPSEALVSPIAVLFYQTYKDRRELNDQLSLHHEKIQCIVSNPDYLEEAIPFGASQVPMLTDYADNVDTLQFLSKL